MQPERAIVFELDDTLYPYRRFRTSGLIAVADRIGLRTGVPPRLARATLLGVARTAERERAIEICLERHDLSPSLAPALEEVFHHHVPRLKRMPAVTRTLVGLRAMGWRLGVLTNGHPTIQARKIAALGLTPFLDAVVYAATTSVVGKPHPDAFAAIARALGVFASDTIVVGTDEARDVRGALTAGMHAIRCDVWVRQSRPTAASARLTRFVDLPALARAIMRERGVRRAA